MEDRLTPRIISNLQRKITSRGKRNDDRSRRRALHTSGSSGKMDFCYQEVFGGEENSPLLKSKGLADGLALRPEGREFPFRSVNALHLICNNLYLNRLANGGDEEINRFQVPERQRPATGKRTDERWSQLFVLPPAHLHRIQLISTYSWCLAFVPFPSRPRLDVPLSLTVPPCPPFCYSPNTLSSSHLPALSSVPPASSPFPHFSLPRLPSISTFSLFTFLLLFLFCLSPPFVPSLFCISPLKHTLLRLLSLISCERHSRRL